MVVDHPFVPPGCLRKYSLEATSHRSMGKDGSFLSRTKGLRYVSTVYTRTARTDGWRLGLAWPVLRVRAIQHCPGRGILIPRCAITEDARHIWYMGLGGEWSAIWVLPSSPALGHIGFHFNRLDHGLLR